MEPITTSLLLGGAIGARTIGGLFETGSERRRLERLRAELLREINKREAFLKFRAGVPGENFGNLLNRTLRRTRLSLAAGGLAGEGTVGPAALAEATAPLVADENAELRRMSEALFSARMNVMSNTSLPGYGSAFGQAFGDTSDILGFLAGQGLYGNKQMQ